MSTRSHGYHYPASSPGTFVKRIIGEQLGGVLKQASNKRKKGPYKTITVKRSGGRRSTPDVYHTGRVGRTGYSSTNAVSGRWKGKRKLVKRVTYAKNNKKVKVSKELRKKINKVITQDKPCGEFESLNFEGYKQANHNQQLVKYLGAEDYNFSHGYFHPLRVLDAASVLFNQKAISLENPGITDTDNFNSTSIKIKVVKSWVKLTLRNNTDRTWDGHIYECAPKSNQTTSEPVTCWTNALTSEYNAIQGAQQTNQTLTANPLINIGGSLAITNPYASPRQADQFNRWYDVIQKKVHLEPGEVYEHIVTGPADYVYNFPKMYNGTTANFIQKCNRYVFFALNLDMLSTQTPVFGRWGQNNTNQYLICESREFFKIEMPEETGFQSNAVSTLVPAGTPQNLNKRHKVKYSIYRGDAFAGSTVRFDEQQPATSETTN